MAESKRKLFIGGNWKSNNTLQQTKDLVRDVYNKLTFDENRVEVIASPVSLHICTVVADLTSKVQVAAQNCSDKAFGAFTGEISPLHIKDLGLKWVIIGHSERRQIYKETDELLASKAKLAVNNGLSVIYCIGETLDEREKGDTLKVVETQLNALTGSLSKEEWEKLVIAYEPVWAIGTGKVATTEQAEEVHKNIREWLSKTISPETAESVRIIYGGSVTEKNSGDLIKQANIDGFLVGGASLKPGFIDIVESTKAKL
eukprot:CAMPEP_0176475162 /NCGR_PEP_ID=MMETSP0127-20121128/43450_1 /TAXON_ID=938130 /ORGANISM="Platyophrya macrostoma, Strain WH" /LENGTH=257 /DNA_ID=CAMNT_0017870721 /DNA_START=27 /DNA_END=800 /DNA_ORIENTATION=-